MHSSLTESHDNEKNDHILV